MRWRSLAFTVLVVLTTAMACLFVGFCWRLMNEGNAEPLLAGTIIAGVLTVFGVWAAERCFRSL